MYEIKGRDLEGFKGMDSVKRIIIEELEYFLRTDRNSTEIMIMLTQELINAADALWLDFDKKTLGELRTVLTQMLTDKKFMHEEIKRCVKARSQYLEKRILENG